MQAHVRNRSPVRTRIGEGNMIQKDIRIRSNFAARLFWNRHFHKIEIISDGSIISDQRSKMPVHQLFHEGKHKTHRGKNGSKHSHADFSAHQGKKQDAKHPEISQQRYEFHEKFNGI